MVKERTAEQFVAPHRGTMWSVLMADRKVKEKLVPLN
jgi:hypothetical protein